MNWKKLYGAIFKASPRVIVWKAIVQAEELSVDDKIFIPSTLQNTSTNRQKVDDYSIKAGTLRLHDVHERKGYLVWVLTISGIRRRT